MKKALLILSLLASSACGFQTVETGHRGFFVHFGEVEEKVLTEGLYFYNPFTTSLVQLNVQTKVTQFKTETYTKDIQVGDITYTLTYNLQPEFAATTFKQAGSEWEEKLVAPVLAGAVKQIIGQYDAVELISQRAKATQAVKDNVTAKLEASHVHLIELQLSDVAYSKGFEQAVEAKVIATQTAEQAKNKTVQVEEEARQKVIAAEAEAKSMLIRSEALQKNQNLVSYEAVQKWNGVLPQYMLGSGSVPFLNLKANDK